MAVAIIKRPKGFVIGDVLGVTKLECFIDNLNGRADVARSDRGIHSLNNGETVYVKSPVGEYNGFWIVEVVDTNEFYLQPFSGTEYVPFIKTTGSTTDGDIQEGTAYYHETIEHPWNCVHLPIVYQISNDVWPTNSVTSIRDISTAADSNGYTRLTFALSLNVTQELEKVQITGCTDDSLNGIWTVIVHNSNTDFVIDLPYTSAGDTDLTNNGSAQLYFNNYLVKVQVWGGLINSHEYYGQKPYELLATLDLIPDENNICKFSVSDILKKHIELENNLLLGTLPNNLDAWTGFFIKFGEEYDISDGEELSRSTVTYTSDLNNFQGRAVNAMLPFKNVYSGAMSEYASADEDQKFLTNFERPVLFQDKYFDLSFVWEGVSTFFFLKEFYDNNVLQATEIGEALDAFYTGVYRAQIEANCQYDRVDVTAYESTGVPLANIWSDSVIGDSAFNVKTGRTFQRTDLLAGFYSALTPVTVNDGETLEITIIVTVAGGGTGSMSVILMDSAEVTTYAIDIESPIPTGTTTYTFSLPSTGSATRLKIRTGLIAGNTMTVTIPPVMSITNSGSVISETKTIDINCECIPTQSEEGIYLSWLNNIGGFEHWLFTANKDHIIDITETEETESNTFVEWPNSYGEFADTIRKETFRDSRKQALVRSQNLTSDQLEVIKTIKSSPLVQIVNSIYDRRTVIVDADSFTWKKEGQAQTDPYKISFTITYTDNIPSQRA